MACTTILVGKKASYDGSTTVSYTHLLLVLVLFAHGGDHIPEQPHRQQAGAQGEPDTGGEQQHLSLIHI